MAIQSVRKMKGFSLVELMIASAVGLISIAVVGSVFISGYTFSSQRSLQLMLEQDANDALRMLKSDLLRAGYASGAQSTFVVSGATKTVHLFTPATPSTPASCIIYGYHGVGADKHFRTYYYNPQDETLRVLSTKSSVLSTADGCSGGQSILDERQIRVKKFEVVENVISSAVSTSQYLTVNLDVATLDGSISSEKSIEVKTRNWN